MFLVIKVDIKVMAQTCKSEFPSLLSYAYFRKFSLKINVSNSFKTLPVSDSNVFFLSFETEINRIPSYPKKAMVNIYKNLFEPQPPSPPSPFYLLPPCFSRWVQVAQEVILKYPLPPPFQRIIEKVSLPFLFFHPLCN